MNDMASRLLESEPKLAKLVELCKTELQASEVWLFGSRARGDHESDSDWDLLAVIPDEAPDDIDSPLKAWEVRRASGLSSDLLTVRAQAFVEAQATANTISYAVAHEGLRLDS